MSDEANTFNGRCHCGGIAVHLTFTRPAEAMQVRSCQCQFCIRHGSLTVSDPAGKAVLEIEAGQLQAYKFGTQSSTVLICRRCGVYAGVLLAEGGNLWSVANARGLAIDEFKERTGVQVVYEDETPAERILRRKQKWTPTEIRFKI